MNKLREKFYKKLGIDCLTEQCEEINDDFSVKLLEWFLNLDITQRGKDNFVCWDGVQRTITELQQYFKDNIYGKE